MFYRFSGDFLRKQKKGDCRRRIGMCQMEREQRGKIVKVVSPRRGRGALVYWCW